MFAVLLFPVMSIWLQGSATGGWPSLACLEGDADNISQISNSVQMALS